METNAATDPVAGVHFRMVEVAQGERVTTAGERMGPRPAQTRCSLGRCAKGGSGAHDKDPWLDRDSWETLYSDTPARLRAHRRAVPMVRSRRSDRQVKHGRGLHIWCPEGATGAPQYSR